MSGRAVMPWAAGAALGLVALALGGCGFTALYAETGVAAGITHIEVQAPQGREGYLLREDLDDEFGHVKGDAPLYRLSMEVTPTRAAHGLTENATAQRYELDLTVDYTLTEIATGKEVHKGRVVSEISYDSADQPYAGIAARQDVQNRLAEDAAQKIQVQVAAWLAAHGAS